MRMLGAGGSASIGLAGKLRLERARGPQRANRDRSGRSGLRGGRSWRSVWRRLSVSGLAVRAVAPGLGRASCTSTSAFWQPRPRAGRVAGRSRLFGGAAGGLLCFFSWEWRNGPVSFGHQTSISISVVSSGGSALGRGRLGQWGLFAASSSRFGRRLPLATGASIPGPAVASRILGAGCSAIGGRLDDFSRRLLRHRPRRSGVGGLAGRWRFGSAPSAGGCSANGLGRLGRGGVSPSCAACGNRGCAGCAWKSSPEQPTSDIMSGTMVKPPPSTEPAGRFSSGKRGRQKTRSRMMSARRSSMSMRTTRLPQMR